MSFLLDLYTEDDNFNLEPVQEKNKKDALKKEDKESPKGKAADLPEGDHDTKIEDTIAKLDTRTDSASEEMTDKGANKEEGEDGNNKDTSELDHDHDVSIDEETAKIDTQADDHQDKTEPSPEDAMGAEEDGTDAGTEGDTPDPTSDLDSDGTGATGDDNGESSDSGFTPDPTGSLDNTDSPNPDGSVSGGGDVNPQSPEASEDAAAQPERLLTIFKSFKSFSQVIEQYLDSLNDTIPNITDISIRQAARSLFNNVLITKGQLEGIRMISFTPKNLEKLDKLYKVMIKKIDLIAEQVIKIIPNEKNNKKDSKK